MRRTDIINALNRLDVYDLIDTHNAALRETNDVDHCIYEMWELNSFFYGALAEDILCKAYYGKFNPTDPWFSLNGYGNLVSFCNRNDVMKHIDLDDIADVYEESPEVFHNTALAAMLGDN